MPDFDNEIRQLKNRLTTLEGRLRIHESSVGDAKEDASLALSNSINNDGRITELDDRVNDLEDGK